MSTRSALTRITVADVVSYAKQRSQNPTAEDAERWLTRKRRRIQDMMREVIEKNLERILDEACLEGYPDPAFDAQYNAVDEAIMAATDEYAGRIGKEHFGSSHTEREMLAVTRRILENPSNFSACLAFEQEFGDPADFQDRVVTHRTKRVHLRCDEGHIHAEVVQDDDCQHPSNVFRPESLHHLH